MKNECLRDYYARLQKEESQKEYLYINKSGFFDLPQHRVCQHPEHNPPSHMVIPYGKGYRHVCPSCGNVSVVYSNSITC